VTDIPQFVDEIPLDLAHLALVYVLRGSLRVSEYEASETQEHGQADEVGHALVAQLTQLLHPLWVVQLKAFPFMPGLQVEVV